MRSMTGFGAAQGQIDGVEYSIEIRSVNHRFFKVVLKLPEIWSHAEADIDALVRESAARYRNMIAVSTPPAEELHHGVSLAKRIFDAVEMRVKTWVFGMATEQDGDAHLITQQEVDRKKVRARASEREFVARARSSGAARRRRGTRTPHMATARGRRR